MNNNFFEVGVKYGKLVRDKGLRFVSESYVVEATSFAEAEAKVTNEINPYTDDKLLVTSIKRSNIDEIIPDGAEDIITLYKAKLNLLIADYANGEYKKVPHYLLIFACSVEAAHQMVVSKKEDWGNSYEIASIDETKFIDVLWRDDDAQ